MLYSVIALVVAVIALAVSVLTVREQQKDILIQTFLDYNRRYAEVMNSLPKELLFRSHQYKALYQFCNDTGEDLNDVRDKIFRYLDLCYEEYNLGRLGGGLLVLRRWRAMLFLWDKGIWQNTNYRPIKEIFEQYVEMHGAGRSGRYTPEFIEYVKGIIYLHQEPDKQNWDLKNRKPLAGNAMKGK